MFGEQPYMFYLSVVGQDILDDVLACMDKLKIHKVNPINIGKLGNIKVFTYSIEFAPEEVISKRRDILSTMAATDRLLPMYEHGDWMNAYIFKKTMFRKENENERKFDGKGAQICESGHAKGIGCREE